MNMDDIILPEVEQLYQHALKLDPDFTLAISGYAKVLCYTDKVSAAKRLYHDAAERSPLKADLLASYAEFLFDQGGASNIDLASDMYTKAVAIDPQVAFLLGHARVYLFGLHNP